ncbi:MAG TPA: TlyA family RNA methyltransferase, partial [Burkholderiaceae bacterium]|nr:TlyA family RNA methyltransferase [Burkholderiaceae bacterium]
EREPVRADQLLVQRALAPTRSAAQRLIDAGAVRWLGPKGWALPRKAGEDLPADCEVEVTDDAELRYASRGGLKLEAALAHCGIDVAGANALDIGQSTGGFTDVLLQRGALRVVGLDVGRGQLAAALASDARVVCHEGINARDVTGSEFAQAEPVKSFGIVVADLSFITLTHVLPTIAAYLADDGNAVLLVKPQFELQPEDIGKGGMVKHASAYPRVETRIRDACRALDLEVQRYFESTVAGGDGNREFFVWARQALGVPSPAPTPPKKKPTHRGEAP